MTKSNRWSTRRVLLFLVPVLALYSFPIGLTPTFLGPNEASYGFLTIALYERGSWNVDAEVARFWAMEDLSVHDGHFYTNKAPGLSLWLLLFAPLVDLVTPGRLQLVELTYFGRVLALTLPFVVFLFLFGRFLERIAGPAIAWTLVVAYALGTNAGVYATLLNNHNLTTMSLFAAFVILWRGDWRRFWIAGLAAGFAVLLEMPTILFSITFAVLAGALAERGARAKALLVFTAGALPMAAILLYYNWSCFGNPFVVSYMRDSKYLLADQGQIYAMTLPSLGRIFGLLASPSRGLFFHSPWMLLAVPGMLLLRDALPARQRRLLTGMLCAAAALLLFISSHLYWHGYATFGSRYLIVIYPFMTVCAAIAAARAAGRWQTAVKIGLVGAAVVSIAIHLLAIMAFPVIPWVPDGLLLNPLAGFLLPYLARGLGTYTLANQFGASVATSHAILVGIALAAFAGLSLPSLRPGTRSSRRIVFYGCVLGACLAALWLQFGSKTTPQTPYWRDEVAAPWRHRTTSPPTTLPRI
ncbi:MAG: hypothetical protein ACKVU1_08025 [bacterium]